MNIDWWVTSHKYTEKVRFYLLGAVFWDHEQGCRPAKDFFTRCRRMDLCDFYGWLGEYNELVQGGAPPVLNGF